MCCSFDIQKGFSPMLMIKLLQMMERQSSSLVVRLLGSSASYMRRFLFRVLSVGPVPHHVAFILDGNRRFARKWKMEDVMGYRAGFLSLMTLIKCCYELGVKYITIYVFSIENFKRKPDEVRSVMDLMLEKIEGLLKEESILEQYGVRLEFVGNLKLLNESVRISAEKAMKATACNDRVILVVAVAYTSTDEMVHAAEQCCQDKSVDGKLVEVADVERHMYMAGVPDPDILVRTSGETRLSNFLLWQTSNSLLYSPKALWPDVGLHHLIWAVLNFQRVQPYLRTRRNYLPLSTQ
ncbi:dehydrodolichyl diphosphate synthase 6-like isoform X1 [Salvia miltiorrhiza]|uniref:dehydrodolichyl diphosphate synthase 6-like isoform X1 n=2 Tax=Salvia miltiorrhiza TaxID=226208 RepID=UPI0025AB87FE|nr:dehydrodolichyl diphosphate synthase 6-like isoform X1 [Salvia miltiorrhiza]